MSTHQNDKIVDDIKDGLAEIVGMVEEYDKKIRALSYQNTKNLEKLLEVLKKFNGSIACKYCKDIEELEGEYAGELHEGKTIDCDECGATYYEEFEGDILATNIPAHINHPELKKLF